MAVIVFVWAASVGVGENVVLSLLIGAVGFIIGSRIVRSVRMGVVGTVLERVVALVKRELGKSELCTSGASAVGGFPRSPEFVVGEG